jgi:hypothetical protein
MTADWCRELLDHFVGAFQNLLQNQTTDQIFGICAVIEKNWEYSAEYMSFSSVQESLQIY